MKFTKMHSSGNDYVYINGFKENIPDPEKAAVTLSDRHFGIGSDGIVIILPSKVADFRMRMFNADGSEGKMCGNASICIGKYVYENKLTKKTSVTLETLSGIKTLCLEVRDGKVISTSVDMGEAILKADQIPVLTDGEDFICRPIEMPHGGTLYGTAVSMGNPHVVFFVSDTNFSEFECYGRFAETLNIFPERVNTEFVKLISENELDMRVWERGSGETLACGTGTCASVVAAVLNDYCKYDTEIKVNLRGGTLFVTYKSDKTVSLRGSGVTVFEGEIN